MYYRTVLANTNIAARYIFVVNISIYLPVVPIGQLSLNELHISYLKKQDGIQSFNKFKNITVISLAQFYAYGDMVTIMSELFNGNVDSIFRLKSPLAFRAV